jgi:hypothetical protein
MAAFLLIAPPWIVLRVIRRRLAGGELMIALWPFLAALAAAAVIVPLVSSGESLVGQFGRLTWASGALFIGSLFCPLLSPAALGVVLLQARRTGKGSFWTLAVAASIGAVALSAYLVFWGVFALRTWV